MLENPFQSIKAKKQCLLTSEAVMLGVAVGAPIRPVAPKDGESLTNDSPAENYIRFRKFT